MCIIMLSIFHLQCKWTYTQHNNAHIFYGESVYSVNRQIIQAQISIMLTPVLFQNENPGPGTYCPLPSAETFSPSFSKKGTTSFPSKVSHTLVLLMTSSSLLAN